MKEKWILDWRITRFRDRMEFDTFEEARDVFRNKIAREIDVPEYLDFLSEELETAVDGEQIAEFLSRFFRNELTEEHLIETDFFGEFEATFSREGFKMAESEYCDLQSYPTIESNFVMMEDPERAYHFYFVDPYDTDGVNPDFCGYDYELNLRKETM